MHVLLSLVIVALTLDSFEVNGAPPTDEFLQKRWSSGCQKGRYDQEDVRIYEDGVYLMSEFAYFHDAWYPCYDVRSIITTRGNYSVGAEPAKTSDPRNLDMTITSVTLTLFTSYLVAKANHYQLCGRDDWELYEPMSIAGKTCHPYQIEAKVDPKRKPYPSIGDKIYDIYRYHTSRVVYFGKMTETDDGSSEAKRPTQLNTNLPMYDRP